MPPCVYLFVCSIKIGGFCVELSRSWIPVVGVSPSYCWHLNQHCLFQMSSDLRSTIDQRLGEYLSSNLLLGQYPHVLEARQGLVDSLLDGSVYSVVKSLNHLQEIKQTYVSSTSIILMPCLTVLF